MISSFLSYSFKHQRPIKVMLMPGIEPQSFNLTVQEIGEDGFSYLSAKNKKKTKTLRYEDVLAACYARGDDGDTLKTGKDEKQT